jgi:hypothetical protein
MSERAVQLPTDYRVYGEVEMKGAKREAGWCGQVYMGARVPELYQSPVPMNPLEEVKTTVKGDPRFL